MIVRSYSRRTSSFHQLLSYLTRDGRMSDITPLGVNLFSPGVPDPDSSPDIPDNSHASDILDPLDPLVPSDALDPAFREVADEFVENARHLKPRKNGVVLYHEILSFAEADRPRATPAMLVDLALFYLRQRAPGALAFGVVHADRDNLHIHLVISANRRGEPNRIRLTRAGFREKKERLEARQRERYPGLVHSRVDHGSSPEQKRRKQKQRERADAPRLSHAEHQRNRRLERQQKREPSRKEILAGILRPALAVCPTFDSFRRFCAQRGIVLSHRNGRLSGIVVSTGAPKPGAPSDPVPSRKYRFSTLGLAPDLERALGAWERSSERLRSFHGASAEWLRREWRLETGYAEDISALIREGEHLKRLSDPKERRFVRDTHTILRGHRADARECFFRERAPGRSPIPGSRSPLPPDPSSGPSRGLEP